MKVITKTAPARVSRFCRKCGKTPCCCGTRRGPQGVQGAQGTQGTGFDPDAGCCRIGVLEIDGGGSSADFDVTAAMLENPSHPGATYAELVFVNFGAGVVVFLPTPASNDDAFTIGVENRSGNELGISNSASTGSSLDSVRLRAFLGSEQESDNWRAGALPTSVTYRQMVSTRINGVFAYVGYSFEGD
jgi:hypothetical protein